MRKTPWPAVLAGACLSVSALAGELTVTKAATAPKIDGDLNDPCWKDAAKIEELYILDEPGKTSKDHKMWVTFDDQWLYAAYDIRQADRDRRPPKRLKHDDYIQRDDCVKLSFDPGTDGAMFYHFKINRANARRELRRGDEKGMEIFNWNIPWRSAAKSGPDGWTAEIAVPLSQLPPFGKLDQAKINLLATRYVSLRDNYAVIVGEKSERLSAAPLLKDFNEPKRFLPVKGLAGLTPRAAFLPYFEDVKVGEYQMKNGRYGYDVFLKLTPFSGVAGQVSLELEDTAEGAAPERVAKTVDIPANSGPIAVTLSMPVKSLAKRTVKLRMLDAKTGEELQWEALDQLSALEVFSAYLDRSYYTDEKTAAVICAIGLPETAVAKLKLLARNAAGNILAETAGLKTSARLALPIDKLAEGENAIEVVLADTDNRAVSSQKLTLVKRAPKPGFEWKIDRVSRVILKDGAPFFPFGIFTHGQFSTAAIAKDVASAGFNSVAYWPSKTNPKDLPTYCAEAAANNLTVIAYIEGVCQPAGKDIFASVLSGAELKTVQNKYAGDTLTGLKCRLCMDPLLVKLTRENKNKLFAAYFDNNFARLKEGVEILKEQPNFAAYVTFDEPQLEIFDQDVQGRILYNETNKIDGYHPTGVLYSSSIPDMPQATDWADIVITDPYWIPGDNTRFRGNINFVSYITYLTKKRADSERKVCWIVPMAWGWSATWKRSVTDDEACCQTYLALIHGAKGLLYFAYPVHEQRLWDTYKSLSKQIAGLAPYILGPDVPQEVSYSPGDYQPDKQIFPDVQAALFKAPGGDYVLLAANCRDYPVETTFSVSNLSGDRVQRFLARRDVPAPSGKFTEVISPYGTRAYRFAAGENVNGPIKIKVTMDPITALAINEPPQVPKEQALPGKNKVPNPGFEEAANPDCPDYCVLYNTGGDERIGTKNPAYCLDPVNPAEGKVALRINGRPGDNKNVGKYVWVEKSMVPKEYVFSVALRADADNTPVTVQSFGRWTERVKIGKEWTRFSKTFTMPANQTENRFHVSLQPKDKPARIWVDDMRLEAVEK